MQVSLIVPIYNEVANLQKGVLDRIGAYTRDDVRFTEVLIVDDGSTDESVHIVKECYLALYPKFRLIECEHRGKAPTVISGIQAAGGTHVFFTDADLATPIEEADKLLDGLARTHAAIIIGSRGVGRPDAPLTRKVLSIGMIIIRSIFFGLKGVKDTQCGFKLFQRDAAIHIIDKLQVFRRRTTGHHASVTAIFDLEFLCIGRRLGYQIVEVPVIWLHVETRRVSFVRDMIESLTDMARLKWYQLKGAYR